MSKQATLPSTDKATRQRLSGLLSEWGTAGAHARLAKIDAESARRIHPNDRQRI